MTGLFEALAGILTLMGVGFLFMAGWIETKGWLPLHEALSLGLLCGSVAALMFIYAAGRSGL